MRYIDASVFVRYLTQDQPEMSRAALGLFLRVEGGAEKVRVLEATVTEIVYVLSSRRLYNLARQDILERLTPVLSLASLLVQNRTRCLNALYLYVQNGSVNFADCLIAAAAMDESPAEVYSFDHGFDRIGGLERIEP